jgi:hypothetical protein
VSRDRWIALLNRFESRSQPSLDLLDRLLSSSATNADGVHAECSRRLEVSTARPDVGRVKTVYVVRGPAQRSIHRISAPTATSTPIKKTIAIDCSITVTRNLKPSSERLVAALIMPPTLSVSAWRIDGSKGPSQTQARMSISPHGPRPPCGRSFTSRASSSHSSERSHDARRCC